MTLKIMAFILNLILIVYALKGRRWAYFSLIALAIVYFPLSVKFNFIPGPVDLKVNWELFVVSLKNYRHIILFALFFIMTSRQLKPTGWKNFILSGFITIVLGIYVEFAQWYTGNGHCRLRDLIPDAVGALIGSVIVYFLLFSTRKQMQKDTSD